MKKGNFIPPFLCLPVRCAKLFFDNHCCRIKIKNELEINKISNRLRRFEILIILPYKNV